MMERGLPLELTFEKLNSNKEEDFCSKSGLVVVLLIGEGLLCFEQDNLDGIKRFSEFKERRNFDVIVYSHIGSVERCSKTKKENIKCEIK